MRSGEYRARPLGIDGRTTGHDATAEPLIGGNEHFNLPELAQFDRNGELHCIKGAEAFRHTELNQESPCAVKVAFVDRWGNTNTRLVPSICTRSSRTSEVSPCVREARRWAREMTTRFKNRSP